MGRPVILGNGSLTVGLNEQGLVNDFYYPYVGLDNLNTSRSMHHRIGVWINGHFSWTDDGSWHISVTFENTALVSTVSMKSDNLNIRLDLVDFVDHEVNAFYRQINVTNLSDEARVVRLFMHQVFQISRAGRADTALFVPDDNYILDYKGRCSLLIYAQVSGGAPFDQFAVGNYGIEGKEGTFKDAEDGELSGNAVEHGGVDSVLRLRTEIEPGKIQGLEYWVVAADSQYNAEAIHDDILSQGLPQRLDSTRIYWNEWLKIGTSNLLSILNQRRLDAVRKSLMVIKVHMDKRGGIIASCDSSIYNYGRDYYSYVWPRDGAFAVWPLIKLGYQDEPKLFFEFCRDILNRDGYLMHKYQPDRAVGSTWHPILHGLRKELPIQEDETAIVIVMLAEYAKYSKDEDFVYSLYTTLVQPAANFMCKFIDKQTHLPHASYDLWEEKFLTTPYSTTFVHSALLSAAVFADQFDYPDDALHWRTTAKAIQNGYSIFFNEERRILNKGFLLQPDGSVQHDTTLDVSSLYAGLFFNTNGLNDNYLSDTATAIENILLDKSPSGGTPRYEYDNYFISKPPYLGNPWYVTTLWMAQCYALAGQVEKTDHYIDWAMAHSLPSGVLSEQINPSDGTLLSVTPLVWSHAELINTILALHNTVDS